MMFEPEEEWYECDQCCYGTNSMLKLEQHELNEHLPERRENYSQ